MKYFKDFTVIKYFLLLFTTLIMVRFIFTGGLTVLNVAFKPLLMALIIIYLLDPISDLLNRKTKLNRTGSVIIAYIGLLLFLSLFLIMVIPSLVSSISNMIENLKQYDEASVVTLINRIPLLNKYVDLSTIETMLGEIETLVINYSSELINYSSTILSSIGSALWTFILFIMSLIMAFFALKESDHIGQKIEDLFMAFLPDRLALKIIKVLALTNKAIKRYLVSKLYTCLILGVIVFICIIIINWLTPFHIPYAPLVAFLIGLSNLIPYVGAVIALPAVLLGFLSGLWEGIILLIIIFVAQQIDNLIITPKIVSDKVGLSAFWVIVSITVGGSLFGAIGMIVSVPIVSVIIRLVEEHVQFYQTHKKALEENEVVESNSNA